VEAPCDGANRYVSCHAHGQQFSKSSFLFHSAPVQKRSSVGREARRQIPPCAATSLRHGRFSQSPWQMFRGMGGEGMGWDGMGRCGGSGQFLYGTFLPFPKIKRTAEAPCQTGSLGISACRPPCISHFQPLWKWKCSRRTPRWQSPSSELLA
jgi:hypothetical protein